MTGLRSVWVISASREPEGTEVPITDVTHKIFYENTRGLPEVYNEVLDSTVGGRIVVFAHDDLWLEDSHYFEKLNEAVNQGYSVIGLAGTTAYPWEYDRRLFWWHTPKETRSGAVCHPYGDRYLVATYGPAPMEVKLLDGLFLAVNVDAVRRAGVRFDEQFDFHFYDLDFCMQATQAGLRLTTWPIWATHRSIGLTTDEGREIWNRNALLFLEKYRIVEEYG